MIPWVSVSDGPVIFGVSARTDSSEELGEEKPRLDRLAEPHRVGNQKPRPRLAQGEPRRLVAHDLGEPETLEDLVAVPHRVRAGNEPFGVADDEALGRDISMVVCVVPRRRFE